MLEPFLLGNLLERNVTCLISLFSAAQISAETLSFAGNQGGVLLDELFHFTAKI